MWWFALYILVDGIYVLVGALVGLEIIEINWKFAGLKRNLGRTGARVAYVILGMLLCAIGVSGLYRYRS